MFATRLSPKVTYALPAARTESATEAGRAAASATTVLAGQIDAPDGSRLIRIFVGLVRSSNQTTVRFPPASTPIRGSRCIPVPGSSLTFTFAVQTAFAPGGSLEK